MPGSRLWNVLGLTLLAFAGLIGLLSVWLFVHPQSRLNPLPLATPQGDSVQALTTTSATPRGVLPAGPASLYPTLPPEWTKTPVPPPTVTRTPRPTLTATASPTPSATLTPTPTLLAQARISGVVGHRQTLSLSCEARSAADWAAFFNVNINEMDFLHRLPVSDNPEVGFVGDVNGDWGYVPPKAYGVHAGPVAELLRAYGAQAQAFRGLSWEDLQREIAAGRPVIVWVVGHLWAGKPMTYTAEDGQTVTVARYEHTVILTGYSGTRATVVDGENTYTQPIKGFLSSWSVLGNMAILWRP